MRRLVGFGLLALFALAGHCNAQSTDNEPPTADASDTNNTTASATAASLSTSLTPSSSVIPKSSNGTCLSRTANYITHTLPQQCLRTDRAASNGTRTTDSSGTVTSGATSTEHSSATTTLGASTSSIEAAAVEAANTDESGPPSIASDTSSRPLHATSPAPPDGAVDTTTTLAEASAESDSPLDNANFLSFEEWKRQNQAKADQAAEQGNSPFVVDRQRPPINNALDSLGDEGEIELDFAGFGDGAAAPRQQQAAYRTAEGGAAAASAAAESYTPRSKDAGKTCKERTNYASFDCAATVLKTNPECKSAPSVLVENKDSYMLNTCSATNKFFIIELCNDILIDTVVLANYEFFSSIFRHFRVSVSDRYPVKMDRWVDLGTFEARNTREVQAFLIEQPQIWTRYLRIEFLTHYGGEYYCPVSLLRVHGTTMLEEIRPEEDVATGDGTENEEALEVQATAIPPIPEESLPPLDEVQKPSIPKEEPAESSPSATESGAQDVTPVVSNDASTQTNTASSSTSEADRKDIMPTSSLYQNDSLTCPPRETATQSSVQPSEATTQLMSAEADRHENVTASSDVSSSSHGGPVSSTTAEDPSMRPLDTNQTSILQMANQTTPANTPPTATNATSTGVDGNVKSNDSTASASPSSNNSTRSSGTTPTSSVAPPQPSTQESFFKSIQKRLQQLEANSTLSLQYIEEQSRILRDAFSKVEKRQISATTTFLTNLNDTVMTELRGFRQAYDQLWQSTVIELEGQREQYQREILAISSRLTLVAEELVWQKRMGIIQSTLVLLCLGLVLFARGGGTIGTGTGYFEAPVLHQMLNRSQTTLGKPTPHEWETPPTSPSPESRSPVSVFRRKILGRSVTDPSTAYAAAADSGTDSRPESKDGPWGLGLGKHGPDVKVEPPTPERNGVPRASGSDGHGVEGDEIGSGLSSPDTARRKSRDFVKFGVT